MYRASPPSTYAANTQTQNAANYSSDDDVYGDDLCHETIATLPLNEPIHRQAPTAQMSPSQAPHATQPTQIITPERTTKLSPTSVVQVPASSPLQAPAAQPRGPTFPAIPRGAFNNGLANAMAPPGTTFRRPQLFASQNPQPQDISDNEVGGMLSSSDDEEKPRSALSSDIKPSVFSRGGKPLPRPGSTQDVVPESPEARGSRFSSFAYTGQKRSSDAFADAYGSSARPVKLPRQTGPARAMPVVQKENEPEMELDDLLDHTLKIKVENMLKVLGNAYSVRVCHDALAKCHGSVTDAMEKLTNWEDEADKNRNRQGAIDLTQSEDELSAKSGKKDRTAFLQPAYKSKPAVKQKVETSRTIQDKWGGSTQANSKSSQKTSQTWRAYEPPTTPKEQAPKGRIINRKRPTALLSPSSPDPLSQPAFSRFAPSQSKLNQSKPIRERQKKRNVISDDEDSGLSSGEDTPDSEEDGSVELVEQPNRLLDFVNTCGAADLIELSNQPQETVDLVISKRPFASLEDIEKISLESTTTTRSGKSRTSRRAVGEQLIRVSREMWDGYEAVDQLVTSCEQLGKPIAAEMKKWGFDAFGTAQNGELQLVDLESGKHDSGSAHDSGIGTPSSTADDPDADNKAHRGRKDNKPQFLQQPKLMSETLVMKDYQVAGLNWLSLLFSKKLSCILADDMGLGKTCQVIAFFAHLYETGVKGPHLVVVPGSTLENWLREFQNFCPALRVEPYYGLQDERAEHRSRLEDEISDINVIVTTYDMAAKEEDAKFLRRRIKPVVCVYDEGHALKNSQSQRYKQLMRIPAQFRLLLTGTPLQNNLQELISLLAFIMPDVFNNAQEHLNYIFKHKAKTADTDHAAFLSAQRISRARSMMTPFILRRKKHQVLKHLPKKDRRVEYCDMTPSQQSIYDGFTEQVQQILAKRTAGQPQDSKEKTNILMKLRQAAIHPLLFRTIFTDAIIREMSQACLKEPKLQDSNPELVFEDMSVMTDWELHRFCVDNPDTMSPYALKNEEWLSSGKVAALVALLRANREAGARTLVFSQFVMVMNILEEVLESIQMPYFRLDGSTRMEQRQDMIDAFHADTSVPVFMLSTKAGGAGINLACANKVIIFDSSFNPQEDVQAENRAHRVGQTRDVEVVRLVTRGTIEEQIHRMGESKLALDERVAGDGAAAAGDAEVGDVATNAATPDTGASNAEKAGIKTVARLLQAKLAGTHTPDVRTDDEDNTTAPPTSRPNTPAAELAHRGRGLDRGSGGDLKDAFLSGLKARGLDLSAAG